MTSYANWQWLCPTCDTWVDDTHTAHIHVRRPRLGIPDMMQQLTQATLEHETYARTGGEPVRVVERYGSLPLPAGRIITMVE